jgi:hypothetical protein
LRLRIAIYFSGSSLVPRSGELAGMGSDQR